MLNLLKVLKDFPKFSQLNSEENRTPRIRNQINLDHLDFDKNVYLKIDKNVIQKLQKSNFVIQRFANMLRLKKLKGKLNTIKLKFS